MASEESIEVSPVITPIAFRYAIDLSNCRSDSPYHIKRALEEFSNGIDLFDYDHDDGIMYVEVSNTLYGNTNDRYSDHVMGQIIGRIVEKTLRSLI